MAAGLLALSLGVLAVSGAAVFRAPAGVRGHFLEVGVGEAASAVVDSLLSRRDGGHAATAAAVIALFCGNHQWWNQWRRQFHRLLVLGFVAVSLFVLQFAVMIFAVSTVFHIISV